MADFKAEGILSVRGNGFKGSLNFTDGTGNNKSTGESVDETEFSCGLFKSEIGADDCIFSRRHSNKTDSAMIFRIIDSGIKSEFLIENIVGVCDYMSKRDLFTGDKLLYNTLLVFINIFIIIIHTNLR